MSEEQTVDLPELDGEDVTLVERIEKKDLEPMYETDHEHIPKLDGEEMGDFVAVVCKKDRCNLGWFIKREEAKALKLL
jgi:hypothetical protein